MKMIDKNQLSIKRMNDGSIVLEFNLNSNNPISPYDKKAILVNGITNEMEEFGSLVLFAEGNDLFLYPYKYRNVKKRENNYLITNWVFRDDINFDKILKNIANYKKAKELEKENKNTIHLNNVSDGFGFRKPKEEKYVSAELVNEFIHKMETSMKEMGDMIDDMIDSNLQTKFKYKEKEKEVHNDIKVFNNEAAKLRTLK